MIAYGQDFKKHQFLIISLCIHLLIGIISVIVVERNLNDHDFQDNQTVQLPTMGPSLQLDDSSQVTITTEPSNDNDITVSVDTDKQESNKNIQADTIQNVPAPKSEKKTLNADATVISEPASNAVQQKKPRKRQIKSVRKRRTSQRKPIEKKITFADIAQGFQNALDSRGSLSNPFFIKGTTSNDSLDESNLKYLSYQNSIMWHIKHTLDEIDPSKYSDEPITEPISCIIRITIAPDGNLKNMYPLNSTGIKKFDLALIENIKKTVPFPPLPERLQYSDFTFNLNIVCVPERYRGKINLNMN